MDEAAQRFVAATVLATLYHELGLDLIDILQLHPAASVLGREEDAAEALSALLIHDIWEDAAAEEMAHHASGAFLAYALEAEDEGGEPVYWGLHSLDMQRYFTLVCLFYGANPNKRADIAEELELPADRAEACPAEFQLAAGSWGTMLEDLAPGPETKGLVMEPGDSDELLYQVLADEVADLNQSYGLPQDIRVSLESCGEANAFYFPQECRIIMCREYADDLGRIWQEADRHFVITRFFFVITKSENLQ